MNLWKQSFCVDAIVGKFDKELGHELKKEAKADYKEHKKDEKEAEKYAKAINKGMRELEDEERKQQHEFAEMLKKQMENE